MHPMDRARLYDATQCGMPMLCVITFLAAFVRKMPHGVHRCGHRHRPGPERAKALSVASVDHSRAT